MAKNQKRVGIGWVFMMQGEIPLSCVCPVNSASNFSQSIRGFVFSNDFFSVDVT